MPDNELELIVEVDVDTANASIKGINEGLSGFEQAARNAGRGASQGIDGFTVSVAKGAAAGAFGREIVYLPQAGEQLTVLMTRYL